MIRSLVIDLDDTLLASARARRRGRRTLAGLGIDPRRFAAAERHWWKEFEELRCTRDEMRLGRFLDFGLNHAQAAAADASYRAIATSINLRRGAGRFLREARRRGLRTVILTNGSADPQLRKIEAAGLTQLVDGIVVTEQVGLHKPRPEPFHHALAIIGGRADSAAMVGDTLYADVAGALEAGFARVFWLTSASMAHPDPRVTPVRDLSSVLHLCE